MKPRCALFLLLFLAGQCFGQEKTLLYSIKGKDAQPSYLFGTVHLIADSAYAFPNKLEKTLFKTQQLVLEIANPTDVQQAQHLLVLASGSLFDIFQPEQADSVIQWGARLLNMKPEVFKQGFSGMKPFMLMQLNAQLAMKGASKSYELELLSKANAHHLSVAGLETMEYQVGLFDQLPDSLLAGMILESIRHPEEEARNQQQLTRLYVAKDVEGLAQFIVESEEPSASIEALIFQRNRNWIPVMEHYMQTQSCFFAVGAGHLGGEKGVIQLLKNAGYTVTPITY